MGYFYTGLFSFAAGAFAGGWYIKHQVAAKALAAATAETKKLLQDAKNKL